METTGLDPERDAILEIGIVKIKMGTIIASESFLIEQDNKIPENITRLTGITDQEVMDMGIPLEEALHKLAFLIKGTIVYGYNVDFDCSFLRYAYDKHKLEFPIGRTKDVLRMARKKIDRILDYKMATVASYFSLEETVKHRALPDCQLTYRILMKLNEK